MHKTAAYGFFFYENTLMPIIKEPILIAFIVFFLVFSLSFNFLSFFCSCFLQFFFL